MPLPMLTHCLHHSSPLSIYTCQTQELRSEWLRSIKQFTLCYQPILGEFYIQVVLSYRTMTFDIRKQDAEEFSASLAILGGTLEKITPRFNFLHLEMKTIGCQFPEMPCT